MNGKLRFALELFGLIVVAAVVVLAADLLNPPEAAPTSEVTAAPGQAESYPPPVKESIAPQPTVDGAYPPPRTMTTEEAIPTDEPTPTDPPFPNPIPTPKVTPIPVASPPFISLVEGTEPEPFTLVYWSGNTLRAINSDGKDDRLLVDFYAKTQFYLAGDVGYLARWEQGGASPDGKKLALVLSSIEQTVTDNQYTEPRYNIYLYDFASGETSILIEDGVEPVWSPNSRYIAFRDIKMGWASGGLWVLDTQTGERWEVYSTKDELEHYVTHISWSPDNQLLLFLDIVLHQSYNIMVTNWDGKSSAQALVPWDLYWKDSPQWSPDGGKILYISSIGEFSVDFRENLWITNHDGPDKKQLTFDMGIFEASWSPDGKWIAFSGYIDFEKNDSSKDIWIIDRNGESLLRLTSNTNGESYRLAAWSPDGSQILFYSNDNHKLTEVWSFSLADGKLTRYPVNMDKFIIFRQLYWDGEK